MTIRCGTRECYETGCRQTPCKLWRKRFNRHRRDNGDGTRRYERAKIVLPPEPTVTTDGNWRNRAACGNIATEDGSPMDPQRAGEREEDAHRRLLAASKRYCIGCPVRVDCQVEGRRNQEHGLWGGLILGHGKPIIGAGGRYAESERRRILKDVS